MKGFTNELHDIAAADAAVMGFDVPHVEVESESETEADLAEMVREENSEDTLFVQVTNNAFVGGASIEEAGARVWLMGRSLGLSMGQFSLSGEEKGLVRRTSRTASCWLLLLTGGVPMERRMAVMEMLCGRVMDEPGRRSVLWKLGRRVSLLAYALNRGVIIRAVLNSFETIGEKWGLTAENKRSAVSAAMNAVREEMVRTGHLPRDFRFWFEKDAEARLVYAQVQAGNGNRAGARNDECRMTNDERRGLSRKQLDAMWERYEQQRLERLCGCRGVTLVMANDEFENDEGEGGAA